MIMAMSTTAAEQTNDGFIESVFGPKRREIVPVAWSFTYFFCVLSSYYIIRPVREEMAVGSGPNTIPYLFIGTFVTMIFATSVSCHEANVPPGTGSVSVTSVPLT